MEWKPKSKIPGTENADAKEKRLIRFSLWTTRDLARFLGIDENTLAIWRIAKPMRGPKFIKLGGARNASVRYRESDIYDWMEAFTCGGDEG